MRNARPLGSYALVRLDSRATETKGGIIIPPAGERQQMLGTVLAVGPGRYVTIDDCDIWHPMELQPGDRVVVGKYNGWEVTEALKHEGTSELWIVETIPGVQSKYHPGDVYLYYRPEEATKAG